MTTALLSFETAGPALPPLIGTSPAIALARSRLSRFARSSLPVLLVGPTGTGKEVMARHLHAMSGRQGRLVDVNCGALPRDMMESLLFGHRRGAFTGAFESTIGLIAQAHAGTLFLDELASLPVEGQAKLLRVLETGEVTPLGAATRQQVDFRPVAAVQDDIFNRIETHQFRRDLFHRIEGVTIRLPALRERVQDIEPLAVHFARYRGCTLDVRCAEMLERQEWPGNVRQLRAVIERASILSDGGVIAAEVLAEAMSMAGHPAEPLRHDAQARLVALCMAYRGDAARIASALGISSATLYRRLRDNGIRLRQLRAFSQNFSPSLSGDEKN